MDMKDDNVAVQKLNFLLSSLGGDPSRITKAFLINNPKLVRMFEDKRENIALKHQDNPQLFKKNDWKDAPDNSLRLSFIQHLSKTVVQTRNLWNDGSQVPYSLLWVSLLRYTSPSSSPQPFPPPFSTSSFFPIPISSPPSLNSQQQSQVS